LTVYLKRYPQERNGWEALAQLQERSGDLIAAAATWEYLGTHFGNRVAATCRQAELLWRASQREQAFSLLQRIQPQANLSDSTYWKLFGDLAWNLKRNADALSAYRVLWKAGQADALGAERLIILARDAGHNNEAITTAELAFHRFSQPRLLLLGMDVAIRASLWQALAHSMEIARQKEQQFQSNEMYWLQRAQLSVHNGRSEEARANYERALQINPKSVSARVSLLWIMIRSDDKLRLSEYIPRWQRDALADSSFWGAYAVAFVKLGRAREALPWFERYVHASPRDYSSLLSYADALTQVGQVEAAWRLRHHTLQQLRAEVKRGSLKLADSK
jgi:tetratricopeptide (TPR) repeat protein